MICELCGNRQTTASNRVCAECMALLPGSLSPATAVTGRAVEASTDTGCSSLDLTARRAVVTGGNRGIGRAIAERLLDCGASVDVLDIDVSSQAGLEAHAATRPGGLTVTRADVTDRAALERVAEDLRTQGTRVDIVVNNAGIFHSGVFSDHARDTWDRQFAVNVTGPFLVSQVMLPLMQNGGRIINIASAAGKMGAALAAGYIASKHAVVGLTKAMAHELAQDGITVNAVAPGYVDTALLRQITEEYATHAGHGDPQRTLQEFLADVPLARVVQPREVADLVVYLASDVSGGMTGQIVNLSAGLLPY